MSALGIGPDHAVIDMGCGTGAFVLHAAPRSLCARTIPLTGPVYPEVLKNHGIACQIPDEADRNMIDAVIFKELVNGVFREESRRCFNEVIHKLKEGGCDAVVLGCTEIPLLVDPGDCPLPTLDSTRLLAKAAVREALCKD